MLQVDGGQEGHEGGDLALPGVERHSGQHRAPRQHNEHQDSGAPRVQPNSVEAVGVSVPPAFIALQTTGDVTKQSRETRAVLHL